MLRRMIFALLSIAVITSISCAKKEESVISEGPLWKPTGNEGNVVGKIKFNGVAPAPAKLDMSQDSACAGDTTVEDVVVNNGGVKNVFMFIKSGLPKASFQIPQNDATLDQKGCRYVPHVLGIQAGQVLKVANSDPTDHNIKTIHKVNPRWDKMQLQGQSPISRKFVKPEVMIPVKCQRHPWMSAYVGVVSNPFFAVSGDDGSFVIKGLPPGEYEIEAWHEKFGTQTAKITVKDKADTIAEFTFSQRTANNRSSLKIQPALILH